MRKIIINSNSIEEKIPSILIVDDEINFARSIVKILKLKKFNISQANNGLEAVEMIKKEKFDIVFMDIKMPMLNGVEAFKLIKNISPKTIVVLMTAYTKDELVKDALKEGVLKVLFKPFDIKEIISLINNYRKLKCKNILIVDDDKSFAKNFKRNLETLNYKCQIAFNGKQAIKFIKDDDFDIIFVDIKLPDFSGAKLIIKLKEINKEINIVTMTAYQDEKEIQNQIQQAFKNNALICLFKPFEFSQVINLLLEF